MSEWCKIFLKLEKTIFVDFSAKITMSSHMRAQISKIHWCSNTNNKPFFSNPAYLHIASAFYISTDIFISQKNNYIEVKLWNEYPKFVEHLLNTAYHKQNYGNLYVFKSPLWKNLTNICRNSFHYLICIWGQRQSSVAPPRWPLGCCRPGSQAPLRCGATGSSQLQLCSTIQQQAAASASPVKESTLNKDHDKSFFLEELTMYHFHH